MFQFQYPYLIILLLIPPLVYLLLSSKSKDSENLPTIYNPNLKRFAKAFGKKGHIISVKGKFNYLFFFFWSLLVFALMHPQQIDKISKTKTKGYDIIMAVDLSRSMLALDFTSTFERKTRLDAVKEVATKFITDRQNDRIGLVLFGNSAYLQTPLTTDVTTVATMLESAEIGMAGKNTAIGDAIALSVKNLKDRQEGSRVLILLTDGTNTAGEINPLEAAEIAAEYGIKIYSIGVGTNASVPFPAGDGRVVKVRVNMDESTLKRISEITSGQYFHAKNKNTLKNIYDRIDELEKTEAESTEIILRQQLYHYPLAAAIILLALKLLLSFNWARLLKWQN